MNIINKMQTLEENNNNLLQMSLYIKVLYMFGKIKCYSIEFVQSVENRGLTGFCNAITSLRTQTNSSLSIFAFAGSSTLYKISVLCTYIYYALHTEYVIYIFIVLLNILIII